MGRSSRRHALLRRKQFPPWLQRLQEHTNWSQQFRSGFVLSQNQQRLWQGHSQWGNAEKQIWPFSRTNREYPHFSESREYPEHDLCWRLPDDLADEAGKWCDSNDDRLCSGRGCSCSDRIDHCCPGMRLCRSNHPKNGVSKVLLVFKHSSLLCLFVLILEPTIKIGAQVMPDRPDLTRRTS